jgi:hypothetical protein
MNIEVGAGSERIVDHPDIAFSATGCNLLLK